MRVAILGGTGSFGHAIAARLVACGQDEVVIGSRDAERARAVAAELGGGATGASNEDSVAGADLVVLAVKADAALATAAAVSAALGTTPLLSVATALSFTKGGVLPDPEALSLAERVAAIVAGPVVAGLHSVAAVNLIDAPPEEDALICGDDAAAKALAIELSARIVAGHSLDAGPLASARALEGMTAVIVNVNRRYKAHAGIRMTGIPET
ncbi:MAG: NAD(P)-binding domain-containing protein [Actinomycetes bacterium]